MALITIVENRRLKFSTAIMTANFVASSYYKITITMAVSQRTSTWLRARVANEASAFGAVSLSAVRTINCYQRTNFGDCGGSAVKAYSACAIELTCVIAHRHSLVPSPESQRKWGLGTRLSLAEKCIVIAS